MSATESSHRHLANALVAEPLSLKLILQSRGLLIHELNQSEVQEINRYLPRSCENLPLERLLQECLPTTWTLFPEDRTGFFRVSFLNKASRPGGFPYNPFLFDLPLPVVLIDEAHIARGNGKKALMVRRLLFTLSESFSEGFWFYGMLEQKRGVEHPFVTQFLQDNCSIKLTIQREIEKNSPVYEIAVHGTRFSFWEAFKSGFEAGVASSIIRKYWYVSGVIDGYQERVFGYRGARAYLDVELKKVGLT